MNDEEYITVEYPTISTVAQNEKGYPTTITVEMADGTHKIYKRG